MSTLPDIEFVELGFMRPFPVRVGTPAQSGAAAELGIKVYTHRVPNRTALTSSPIYDASAHREISLPFISILGRPA